MGIKSNNSSPRHRLPSLRRRSLQGSKASDIVSGNESPRLTTIPTPHNASVVNFAITSDSTLQPRGQDSATYDNSAIYQPVPNLGSSRNSDPRLVRFTVEVKLLNDEQDALLIEVNAALDGQWLFDEVVHRMGGLLESDYFGLRYLDKSKQRQWLDLSKTLYKQLKNVIPRSLNFRVKHYPAKPLEEFRQEKSRYFLYLQLRRDLHSGRLIGRNNDMHILAAHILQAEIGDIDRLEDYLGENGSLADLKMFENMTPRVEAKIKEIYKTLQGLLVADAEAKFLERASELETYGVEPVFVQDRKGNNFYVGLSHEGVTAFRGNRKAHVFPWPKIHRISFDGKIFVIQVEWENRRHTLGFKCRTTEAAEALWKWAVDRQCFFTLNKSSEAKKLKANSRIFKKRPLYLFTGRCQKEMLQMTTSMPNIPQPSVSRSRSLLNIAKSVSQSRQTKSHEVLNGPTDNYLDDSNKKGQIKMSVSADALSEGVHLTGVNSVSAEQLDQTSYQTSNHNSYTKLYQSTEFISTSKSLTVTTPEQNGELTPKLSTAWFQMLPQRSDTMEEVARNEVDKALTHAEIMRLATHRRIEENNQIEEIISVRRSSYEDVTTTPVKRITNDPISNSSDNSKHSTKSGTSIECSNASPSSPRLSLRKLDRQESMENSPQNMNSSSESYSTQVHRPENKEMLLDKADTVPCESSPMSSSSPTSFSSPKIEKNVICRSVVVDPPSGFDDPFTSERPKDIYFPYLSKVKNIDNNSGNLTRLYQPTCFDKPIRDPFSSPSKTEELSVTVELMNDSPKYTHFPLEPSIQTQNVAIKTPTRMERSPLLLRHGYTPYRSFVVNDSIGPPQNNQEEYQRNVVGPRPTIVMAGCAPPVEEPIIVAEYYVPLCDGEEENDEEVSKAESVEITMVNKLTPFDWSAASVRIEKNRNAGSTEGIKRLSSTATAVLSQEIITPRKEMASSGQKSPSKPSDATDGFIKAKSETSSSLTKQTGSNIASSAETHELEEKMLVPVSMYASKEISSVPDLIKAEPVLQKTLIQIPQTKGLEDGDRRRKEEKECPEVYPKASVTSAHDLSSGESFLSPTLVQILWFLSVFLSVHHILKFIRVGPIMGFFGATGPEAIGRWSVIEALVDFFFFRVF